MNKSKYFSVDSAFAGVHGGFVKALVECMLLADDGNFQKLGHAFPKVGRMLEYGRIMGFGCEPPESVNWSSLTKE